MHRLVADCDFRKGIRFASQTTTCILHIGDSDDSIMPTYQLKLYIAGQSVGSQRASANIRRIMEEELPGDYALEVVDIMQDPQLAEQNRIVATPALIKEAPAPARRVIGDLSDRKRVLLGLEIHGTSTE